MSALLGLGVWVLVCQSFPVPEPVLTRTGNTLELHPTSVGLQLIAIHSASDWCLVFAGEVLRGCMPTKSYLYLMPHYAGPGHITELLLWFCLSPTVLWITVSLQRLITEPWLVPDHLSRLPFPTALLPTRRMFQQYKIPVDPWRCMWLFLPGFPDLNQARVHLSLFDY